jgi:hypothetical protein
VVAWICLLGTLLAGCGKQEEATPGPGAEHKGGASLAEARERSKANLKQIAAAFLKCEAVFRSFPVGLVDLKSGRAGLSWRVQILPYLGDADADKLFEQFRLGESWDSDHNKKLLEKMPRVYAPVRGQAPPGHTFYQGFADHYLKAGGKEYGPKEIIPAGSNAWAFFPDPRAYYGQSKDFRGTAFLIPGRRITDIRDGTSNTFLVVEAGEAVPWTKPQDIPFRFDGDAMRKGKGNLPWDTGTWPRLGGMFDGDFHAAMVDGTAIYYIKKDAPVEKLRPFITCNDGINPDYPGIGLQEPVWKEEPPQKGSPKDGGKTGK